jgi:DHA1 family bicyclomycin/chloramphenicol resistance-like MFS transporter
MTRVRPGHVLALGGLSCFGPLALDLCLPSLPLMAADLRTTGTAAQLAMSSAMVGLALGQVLVGPLTDRVGRHRILVLGVALFAVSAGLCAIAPSLPVLLALRVLGGMGGGAGVVVARSMARDLYEGPDLARMYALLMMIVGAAPAVASLLAGQLLQFVDWRGVHAVVAAFGVLLLLTASAQRETLPPERRRRPGDPADLHRMRRALLNDPTFLAPALALGLGLAGMFTYLTMGSLVLHQFYGLEPRSIAAVSAANGLAIVVFSRVSAALSNRVGPAVLLAAGLRLAMVSAAALLLAVALTDQVVALLVPLFLLLGCTGLIVPNATAMALDQRGDLAGRTSAVLGLAQFGTAAVVPPLASLGGISPTVMAATALCTTTAAVVLNAVVLRAGARARPGDTPAWSAHLDTTPLRHSEAPPANRTARPGSTARPGPTGGGPRHPRDDDGHPARPHQLHWRGGSTDPATEDAVRRLMQDESRRRQWRRDGEWTAPEPAKPVEPPAPRAPAGAVRAEPARAGRPQWERPPG